MKPVLNSSYTPKNPTKYVFSKKSSQKLHEGLAKVTFQATERAQKINQPDARTYTLKL